MAARMLPTMKQLEHEFELRRQNHLQNEGERYLQHSQFVHADCVWDVEIVPTTPLPVSNDSSHDKIDIEHHEHENPNTIAVSQEEKKRFESVINEIDSVLKNEIEKSEKYIEKEKGKEEKTEYQSNKLVEPKIINVYSSISKNSNLKFGDIFYQKGDKVKVLYESQNETNRSTKKVSNEFDIVGKFGQLFFDGSKAETESESGYNSPENKENEPESFPKEEEEYDFEDEKVSINITLSKKDLKNNLLTLQRLGVLDPTTNEPLYAVVNKDKKRKVIDIFEAKKTTVDEEIDDACDKNESFDTTVVKRSEKLKTEVGIAYNNEREADRAYEKEITRVDEVIYEREIAFEDEDETDIINGFYGDIPDPTFQNVICDPNYESLQELHHCKSITARVDHKQPIKPQDETDFQEVEIVFDEFEDGGKQSDYLAFLPSKPALSNAESFDNESLMCDKEIQQITNESEAERETHHIPETEINVSGKEKQQILDTEIVVGGKKSIRVKDTEIVLPKTTSVEEPGSKSYEIKTKNVNEPSSKPIKTKDNDSVVLRSKKKDSKSINMNSMPTSLMQYFNDEPSGTTANNNKKGKRSSIFGSTNSLSSVHSTAKPPSDERKGKKTFSLRRKPNPDELFAEPGSYDNFLSIEDNDPVDLAKEVKYLLEMNKNNNTRAHKIVEPPAEKKLFDIPEQIHYDTHYAAVSEKRDLSTLKSGPGFTSLSIRSGDYNRRPSALSESLLY